MEWIAGLDFRDLVFHRSSFAMMQVLGLDVTSIDTVGLAPPASPGRLVAGLRVWGPGFGVLGFDGLRPIRWIARCALGVRV